MDEAHLSEPTLRSRLPFTDATSQPLNDNLQLRRAMSSQAEGVRLLEKHVIEPSAARLVMIAYDSSELLATDSKFLLSKIGSSSLVLHSQAQTTLQILHEQRSLHLELSGNLSTWEELFAPLDSTHPYYPQN
jgi:hypothetical protein